MSREIEFRIFTNGKWYYKCLVGNTNDTNDDNWTCPLVWSDEKKEWVHCDNGVICQYIGLIDRIGTKIYEGDIVKIWGKGFTNKLGCVNAIVVFEEAQFAFYINERYYKIWKDSCGMYEVLGNVYENPELLGENNE